MFGSLPLMFMLSMLLFSYCILNLSAADEELVRKVERWIRYSIHHGERYPYRSFTPVKDMEDTPAEPKQDTKNAFIEDFNSAQCLNESNGYWFWKAGSNSVHTIVKHIETCQSEIMKDLQTWDGTETERMPKWVQTARNIRDTLGWNHFTLYYNALEVATPDRYEGYRGDLSLARIGGFYWEQYESNKRKFSSEKMAELLPEKQFEKFCTKTETPWAMLMDEGIIEALTRANMNNHEKALADSGLLHTLFPLTYDDSPNRLKALAKCGQRASPLLFHIVLYQALLWELLENGGGDGAGTCTGTAAAGESSSSAEQTNGDDDPSLCHRKYIVYWLNTVLAELKKRFNKQHQEFQAKMQVLKSDSGPLQIGIKIWAKYGPYWAEMVKNVAKMGIKGLDESYTMFDGPKIDGQTSGETKAN